MKQELIQSVTIEDIKAAIPSRRNAVTQEIVDIINESRTEPEFQGASLLDTAATYERVVAGRAGVGIKDYLNAIRFCAYLTTLDDNYTEAYKKTFRDRAFVLERLKAPSDSVEYKELTKAASRYRSSKTVVDILTYSQVPLDIMFTGHRYKALEVLADEMTSAKFAKDRIMAAKELLAATKGADNVKLTLDVGVGENTALDQLNTQLAAIAAKQKTLLEAGATSLAELGAVKVVTDQ